MLADGLLTDPRGFHAIDDEDFLDWITRHGAAPEVADFAFIRGLYDLVFADGGANRSHEGVSAGVAAFMTSKMFFEYKGAIFWKMAAGMGDIVFAPMYEALRRRGVRFELFHRVDHLHLSADRTQVDGITMGRQAHLADGVEHYDPLIRVGGLPVFPAAPLTDQLRGADGIEDEPLESHWCRWPDAEVRTLRRGADFDVVVFAIPVAMAELVCEELVDDRPEWKAMVTGLSTTATQAVQLWLREDEPSLGWPHPGATVSAYAQPLNTWASMDQLIPMEQWPEGERPGTIAYFCGSLDAPWPARTSPLTTTGSPTSGGTKRGPARMHGSSSSETSRTCSRGRAAPAASAGSSSAAPEAPSMTQPSTRSSCWRTSIRPTATCAVLRAPTATGCGPMRAATTTSSSPATGPTAASTRGASRPRPCRASKRRTPCSVGRGSTASPASTSAEPVPAPVR